MSWPSRVIVSGTVSRVSGSALPESMTADKVSTFSTEPGS
jgi:hypothetical protein